MNKSTHSTHDYVEALPLTEEQKAALLQQLPAAEGEAFATVHRRLGADDTASAVAAAADIDAPLASVKARVRQQLALTLWKRAQLDEVDNEGRTIASAMPPVKRSSMFPDVVAHQPGWPFLGSI